MRNILKPALLQASVIILGLTANLVSAREFPQRPITIVYPGMAGGSGDIVIRTMAEQLNTTLDQPVVVDNRPGALGVPGTATVVRATPDGHTILITAHASIINAPLMMAKVPYEPKKDLAFITELCTTSLVLSVNAALPIHSMQDFVRWAGANKGKVNYGSFGAGSISHLMGSYLSQSRQLNMTHVAYKSEPPLVQDMIAGEIQWAFTTPGTVIQQIKAGKLRAIATTGTNKRIPLLPDVPTLQEAGFQDPEFQQVGCLVAMAPAKTPPEVLNTLGTALRASIHSPQTVTRLRDVGMEPLGNSSAEFRKHYEESIPVMKKLIEISGAKLN